MERIWLPSIAELIDRLSINQLKEIFIPEHKEKYIKDMNDICHDIDLLIKQDKIEMTSELIKAIIIIAQINAHIWNNESKARKGENQDLHLLELTHGLNGLRNKACNHILKLIGQANKQDWKTDCLAEEFKDWDIDLLKENNNE